MSMPGGGRIPSPFLGHDGAITFAIALIAVPLTLGIAPLAALALVLRRARHTPRTPPEGLAPTRILVLGHRLENGEPSAAFRARLSRALSLAAHHPAARILILGGQTGPGMRTEAEAGRDWLVAEGLAAERIVLERQSRHTLENLRNYRATRPEGPAIELLVTSRLHLARAMVMAEGLGLAPLPVAAEDALRVKPARAVGEAFMIHWYRCGRLTARVLRRRRWLDRIGTG